VAWDDLDALAQRLETLMKTKSPGRVLLAIGGVIGAGKSTISDLLCAQVNQRAGREVCVVVGMDGFHLTRDQLRAMPNSKEAFVRRGAEWTFDAKGFGQLLAQLAEDSKEVQAPTFDHAVKDPVQGGVVIRPQHRIVIVEGIYTQLNYGLWATAALPYFSPDCRWFIDCPIEECEARTVRRHVASGISANLHEGKVRWDTNDGINAKFIMAHLDGGAVSVWLVPPKSSKL
jgi:pantothenate kinase